MIRPGSKAWVQLLQRIYGICWTMLIVGLANRYMSSFSTDAESRTTLIWASRLFMYPSGITIGLLFFLSAFEPIKPPHNWALVYPALRRKK